MGFYQCLCELITSLKNAKKKKEAKMRLYIQVQHFNTLNF